MADLDAVARTPPIVPSTPFEQLPEFLTVPEVQAYLRLGRGSVYQLAQVYGVRFGRMLRVPKSALVEIAKAGR